MLISSETYEVWFTITNFQWWAEIFLFFVGLNMVHGWEMPKGSVLAILMLIGLSTPAGGLIMLVAAAVCCVRWRRKILTKMDILELCAIALPVVVQLTAVLNPTGGRALPQIGIFPISFVQYFLLVLPRKTFLPFTLWGSWNQICACVLFWLPLLYVVARCKKLRKPLIYGVLYIFAAGSLFLITQESTASSGRYNFALISVWLLLVISYVFQAVCWQNRFSGEICKKIFLAAVLIVCVGLVSYRQLPMHVSFTASWRNVEKYMCSDSKTTCMISCAPSPNWRVEVPIRTDFLQAKPSENVLYAVDTIGGWSAAEVQEAYLIVDPGDDTWNMPISGWAIESNQPGTVLVEVNGNYMATQSVNRVEVANYFGIEMEDDEFNAGYEAFIPAHYLRAGKNEINVILISSDGKHCNKMTHVIYLQYE